MATEVPITKVLLAVPNSIVMLIANVLNHLILESSLLTPDFRSFKRQELTFILFNEFLLATLFLTDFLFPSYFGSPPPALVAVLTAAFVGNTAEGIWLLRRSELSPRSMVAITWLTIALNIAIAFALASLSYRQDIQYFALMIAPVFQAAFRLSLASTVVTVATVNSLIFYWVWNYFRLHPPPDANEYVEAATICSIYTVAALLVWTLVTRLRTKQIDLAHSLIELQNTRAQLLIEEKLAAVGRFSSAIAHEIRNPVAMISSALSTGLNEGLNSTEQREMFDIAAKEASRLEHLTTDFLAYARPRSPQKVRTDVADSIAYIADICRPRATEMSIEVRAETPEGLWANIDASQLQQALLNLAMNAIEASPAKSVVLLRGKHATNGLLIEIENPAGPIPPKTAECIFEPFFTTKPTGTGLGLAIARSIVLANGGDLVLSRNQPGFVQFSIIFPTEAS